MGAPGDQKYGSVRFYRRRGNDLAEIPELALVGKDQFKKGLFQIEHQVSHVEAKLCQRFAVKLFETNISP